MLLRALHPCRTAIFSFRRQHTGNRALTQHMGNRALTAPAAHGQLRPHCTRNTWAIVPSPYLPSCMALFHRLCLTSRVMTASSVDSALRRMKHPASPDDGLVSRFPGQSRTGLSPGLYISSSARMYGHAESFLCECKAAARGSYQRQSNRSYAILSPRPTIPPGNIIAPGAHLRLALPTNGFHSKPSLPRPDS